jgi:hypothetical protein
MRGLSSDIQYAIDTIIEGLELEFDVNEIDDDKIRRATDSKIDAFKYSKELLDKWINSPNAPSNEVLTKYVTRLVKATRS